MLNCHAAANYIEVEQLLSDCTQVTVKIALSPFGGQCKGKTLKTYKKVTTYGFKKMSEHTKKIVML